jgi:hypothetical protein
LPAPSYRASWLLYTVGPGGELVRLSDRFGSKDDLIVIHNMGKGQGLPRQRRLPAGRK